MNQGWQNLIDGLKKKGVLNKPHIVDAFLNIDRADFVPENQRHLAYENTALSTLNGQTISQPYTVAFMLDILDPESGNKILDIGAGSGWQTALLAHIVGKESGGGRVYAIELDPDLSEFGKKNVAKKGFFEKNVVEWYCQNGTTGLPEKAPFDKIIAAAALDIGVPEGWFKQLKPSGDLVAPIKNSVWLFKQRRGGSLQSFEHPGFVFVPMKTDL